MAKELSVFSHSLWLWALFIATFLAIVAAFVVLLKIWPIQSWCSECGKAQV